MRSGAAQIQLKEQALAAFPNEQVYEPVDHFAIDEDDGGTQVPRTNLPKIVVEI
jgi:hypothetical protein